MRQMLRWMTVALLCCAAGAVTWAKNPDHLRRTRPHPHYWAPFIVLGQDTPLRSLAPEPAEK